MLGTKPLLSPFPLKPARTILFYFHGKCLIQFSCHLHFLIVAYTESFSLFCFLKFYSKICSVITRFELSEVTSLPSDPHPLPRNIICSLFLFTSLSFNHSFVLFLMLTIFFANFFILHFLSSSFRQFYVGKWLKNVGYVNNVGTAQSWMLIRGKSGLLADRSMAPLQRKVMWSTGLFFSRA